MSLADKVYWERLRAARREEIQNHYLGAYKARRKADHVPGLVNCAPGSEAERVRREGRA